MDHQPGRINPDLTAAPRGPSPGGVCEPVCSASGFAPAQDAGADLTDRLVLFHQGATCVPGEVD